MTVSECSQQSVFVRVAKAAQRLAKVLEPKPGDGDEARRPGTEVARLRATLRTLDKLLEADLVALARTAAERAGAERARIAEALATREAERNDLDKVREGFAEAALGDVWTVVHKDRRDFIGPLTIEHAPGSAKLLFGRSRLRVLDHPSGLEVFEAVREERARLEAEAKAVWPALKAALLPLQARPDDAVRWPEAVRAIAGGSPFKKREPSVVYALALLRNGELEPRWSLSTKPPSLAHQKDAVSIPRIDRPGSPDKVYAIRLESVANAP